MNPETQTSLKVAMRKLIHSSQIKPEAVEVIVSGLQNSEISAEDWGNLFNREGANIAIKQKVYSPQLIRLITLRALVLPKTLPEFLGWLNMQPGKKVNQNQIVCLQFQQTIKELFPREKVLESIGYLLPSLLDGNISPDGLSWLLQKGDNSIWGYAQEQFIHNIKYDLSLIGDHHPKSKENISHQTSFKFGSQVWNQLITSWQDIKKGNYKCQQYRPLAQFCEQLKEYDLAAYFYQISNSKVGKKLFVQLCLLKNCQSPVVFGLPIQQRKPPIDVIINVLNQDVDMKILYVAPISLLILGSGWFIGSTTWHSYINTSEAKEYLCKQSVNGRDCSVIVFDGKDHYSFQDIQTAITKVVDEVWQGKQKSKLKSKVKNSSMQEKITRTLPLILADKTLKYKDLQLSTGKIEPKIERQWIIAVYNYQLKHKLQKKITPQKGEECKGSNIFGLCLLGEKVKKISIDYSPLEKRLKADINKVMTLTAINEAMEKRYWSATKYAINTIILTTIKNNNLDNNSDSNPEKNKSAISDPKSSAEGETIKLPEEQTLTKDLIFELILKNLDVKQYKSIKYADFNTDKIQQTHKRRIAHSIYKFQESQKNPQPTGYLDYKSAEFGELKRKISEQLPISNTPL